MKAKIVWLAGDGVGPEVVQEARRALDAVETRFGHAFAYQECLVGGTAIDALGDPLPKQTLEACLGADAVVLGAVGGPKWDDPSAEVRPEQGLLRLRKELDLFANLRPVQAWPGLESASPLRPELLEGVELVVVRELTGGLYFGQPSFRERTDAGWRAVDTLEYTEAEIHRVVRMAFELARGRRRRLTSVDKANVLESSRLWRQVVQHVAQDYPEVELEHQLVDAAAMRVIRQPAAFDVIVTENMFGDILTDECSVLSGSLGLLPSASLGENRRGMYEPIHGSAPDIAGQGKANPVGTILSVAMLLRHSLGLEREAEVVERAAAHVTADGLRTADLGGTASTEAVGRGIAERISAS